MLITLPQVDQENKEGGCHDVNNIGILKLELHFGLFKVYE